MMMIIAQSVRELRDWGAKHQRRGFNNRMHALQAAILSLKLKHLQQWTTLRQAAAARYEKQLAGHDGLQIPKRRKKRSMFFISLRCWFANEKKQSKN